MSRIPSRFGTATARVRATVLSALLASLATGCAGLGEGWFKSDPATAANEAPPLAARELDPIETEAAIPHLEALTATLERLNANQSQLQIALQDLQLGAAQQADAARRTADELLTARRATLIAGIVATCAVLLSLLLSVILVRQSGQVRRAVRALTKAEAQLAAAAPLAEPASATPAKVTAGRGGRENAGASATGSGAGNGAGSGPGSGASGPGPAGNGPTPARLRQRPPVG
jgi:hypothetical protein